ncbi:nuclear transport factor 2 family protein [candidate division WOR-3 bacterium]|nr:nuclear transport factor 2 family protein [candidate division WOR-3 bacterium]
MIRPLPVVALTLLASMFPACGPKLTPDEKAVRHVLSDYTGALKRGDFASAYALLSQASQRNITPTEFAGGWTKNLTSFEIVKFSVQHASVLHLDQGDYATAVVLRLDLDHETRKKQEDRFDYHLRKESGRWRILRTTELDNKLATLLAEGDTVAVGHLAAICVQVDPVVASTPAEYIEKRKAEWEQRAASTIVFQSSGSGQPKGSPKSVDVNVTGTNFDGYNFIINYVVKNVSRAPVGDIEVRAVFRSPGAKEVLDERTDYIHDELRPAYSRAGSISYYRENDSVREVAADLYVSVDNSDWKTIQNDIVLVVPSVSDVVRISVTSSSFERTMASTWAEYIYTARLDYRITNTSQTSLDYLEVKVVWKSVASGEVVDEESDYIIGSSSTPLAPGESRSGYITCGKGYPASTRAVNADIYLARFYNEYELIRQGVPVR